MRWYAMFICSALAGCFYTGGINHRPEGAIKLDATSSLVLMGHASLEAEVTDPDGDNLTHAWRVVVTDLDNRRYQLTGPGGASDSGVVQDNYAALGPGEEARVFWTLDPLVISSLPRRGQYRVTCRVKDEHGAELELTKTFTVSNQAPSVALKIDGDQAHAYAERIPDTGFADGKPRYPEHAHYVAWLVPKGGGDPEGDLACGGKATVTWSTDPKLKPHLATWAPTACKKGSKELLERLKFQFKPGAFGAPTTIAVAAVVDDGYGGQTKVSTSLQLTPNRPACILATSPDHLDGSTPKPPFKTAVTAVSASAPGSFYVDSISEDVDTGLIYSWYVRDGVTGSFQPVSGGVGGTFAMPPWFRAPGDEIDLRVAVREPGAAVAACAESVDRCVSAGKQLPARCFEWVSWKVKFN